MFNDLGFTLTPDSMISFQTTVMPLLFGSFLVIIGNTGFPCMLRFVIWLTSKLVPHGSGLWEELRFLLDHPRRCFTLLFPSKATWWLFWVLVALNGIDLVFFIILDLNDDTVTSLSPGFRVLNGWFQAASTRTAGFASVNLANLHPAIQVSYLIMMYISVFPVAISVRRTNVYEEKSLGLFGGEEEEDEENRSYVGQHLRRQLSFDLWYIFLGFFIITIVEGHRLEDTNAYAFTMFSVLFEIVSAYGTVGLSLGYPTINASFSAEFASLSKLIIIAMMVRGRHRGLPYALDRAILLPSENLNKNDAEGSTTGRDSTDETAGISRTFTRRDSNIAPDATGNSMDFNPAGIRHMRRGSQVSTKSAGGKSQTPKRRMSKILMAGLSAGPTAGRKHE
jgi:potassium uptake Trk family protein